MINKKSILAVATLMCMTLTSVGASNLVQMDIKKTSDSAVDVTFYTTGTSGNAMVTRKSNNKYVILMPSVAGAGTSTPDLSAVKDLITNVDVKNVDDGMSGYTKVTFITTKPVNIKTHMQKAAPLTQEEKDAKAIIAQVKTHPKQTVAPVEPKKEIQKAKVTSSVAKAETPKVSSDNAKKEKMTVVPIAPKEPVKTVETSKIDTVKQVVANNSDVAVKADVSNKLDIKEVEKIEQISKNLNEKAKANHFGWALVVLQLLGLYLLAKMIRNSIQKSNVLRASFAENLAEKPYVEENYDDIINNSELNWQERYQKFVAESKGKIKNYKYNFIKTAELENSDNADLSDIDKKRVELENTLSKTPEIYEHHDIDLTESVMPEVYSEDDAIQNEIKEIKLKAFAKPISLHATQRNRVKKPLPKLPKAKEGKFVKLQENPLNRTSRRFADANLRVSDLIKTGSQYLPNDDDVQIIEREQNYIMSSLDEYFAILDKEQSKMTAKSSDDLSKKVAASLAQVKPSMNMNRNNSGLKNKKAISNPISLKNQKESYLDGLIVKSGYNIDDNKGFYLVSLDGVTALVGRVKDEIFVLKKFDENVDKMQVRLDNENVYMVKAGDFKSLVDVDDNKMGVLIEL